ncbi:PREDICTED: uncharacterized protein LOC108761001 [Trachymyrmex cornetzi]|uniref:uncharacterized protein LOC108761001 n=1 Tax=Trachymyrmex cornetzi TaxID=471704 RepID=UPI00084F050A|nr:PREDICTED: uncharacterized protein LOC108761001 [Trachymyrmex cornetzi]
MGNLPASRVNPGRPFAQAGVDYAGPFSIKISRNKTGKAYLAVFVCMATKATHLEVVSDLSASAFINALKRFIARRDTSHIEDSRPITPVSTDPSDLNALMPGHFIIGAPLTAIPEPDLENGPLNRTNGRKRSNPNLKVGALVLIRDDNAPPLQWKLGRIIQMFEGSDGLIRTVELETPLGVTQRAVQKICVLTLED